MGEKDRMPGVVGPLYEEHLLLGATFERTELGALRTLAYGASEPVAESLADGTLLADASGMRMLLASGDPVAAFGEAAFAAEPLAVGRAGFSPVFLGDGAVASIPLAARTGDHELLAFDASPRAGVLSAWLTFVAAIEQGGFRPYEGLEVEDVSHDLVPLVLWGNDAPRVLGDYVGGAGALPRAGRVANLMLDGHIPVVACAVELGGAPLYVMLVPPDFARVLWRSLLSFRGVRPTGLAELWDAARERVPWLEAMQKPDRVRLDRADLLEWGLIRPSADFIGGRAL